MDLCVYSLNVVCNLILSGSVSVFGEWMLGLSAEAYVFCGSVGVGSCCVVCVGSGMKGGMILAFCSMSVCAF